MNSPQTLNELFEVQVQKKPNHIATMFANDSLTYKELNKKANQLAHYLIGIGVKADVPVALCFERSIDFLIAMLGVLKAGGAYIPLDPTHPEERLLLILAESQAPVLLSSQELRYKCSRYGGIFVSPNDQQISMQKSENPLSTADGHNLAYIIYTSGSTGKPKGVLIEHQGVVNYASWFADYSQSQVAKKIDFSSNPAFDFAITLSIVPLLLGSTVVFCDDKIKKDPRAYLLYLVNSHINLIKLTPSYFRVLLHEIQNRFIALPDLKQIILGGENLSAVDCASWLALYPNHRLFNEYGPTETSVAVTFYQIDTTNVSHFKENVPIGRLAPGVNAYILDADLALVPDGEVGELYLGGICLARGYLNNSELTAQSFIKNPFNKKGTMRLYKTGDLCCQKSDGTIECIGRIDHQIKIRGFRIELEEIEHCLITHKALKTAVVIASDKYCKEKRLIAYYILNDSTVVINDNELRYYLKSYLPDYMIPTAFVRMAEFPLNANEKLDRAALPIPKFVANQYYLPPNSVLEKQLVDIWSVELGINPIGIEDDFFELGGHSLAAARVITRINHQFEKEISLNDLYQNPTIKRLTVLVEQAEHTQYLKKSAKKELALLPLSDFQFTLWLADTFEPKAKKLNIYARKRVMGLLDYDILSKAFDLLLQKYEVLSYCVSTFSPTQSVRAYQRVQLDCEDLNLLAANQQELALDKSMHELINFHPWPKNKPQLVARLFYLDEHCCELQIAIPHIISDELSLEIILMDLSYFYVSAQEIGSSFKKDLTYRDYIWGEQHYMEHYLKRDVLFWDGYLKDSHLFAFPADKVLENMPGNLSYSTYKEIPEHKLHDLQAFCAKKHISILDGLCASLTMALINCCPDQPLSTSICVNRVKSTRDNSAYDNSLGCFLRIEPIKLAINRENSTLDLLSEQIHNE
ncbi:MAG: amino acid adenylation domain-containing protein, partial [bacterium]|nr:amino acid adenylation domain-containing protein [bacterium]